VLLVIVLKSIKHLSTNASTLETLQNANAIEVLAEVFGKHTTGPHSTVRPAPVVVFVAGGTQLIFAFAIP
jgi:GH43 family beta-xylosidase